MIWDTEKIKKEPVYSLMCLIFNTNSCIKICGWIWGQVSDISHTFAWIL